MARSKRSSSCLVRTKALITRMPESVSRVTWLMRSTLICMDLNSGSALNSNVPITAPMSGTMKMSAVESATSMRTAMMMPPMAVIGARIIMLSPMTTSCCTCCTSLVLRVMSDGVPKKLTSVCENASTRRKMALRRSRPNAMAVLDPQYTETIEIAPTTSETSEHDGPQLQDDGDVALGHALVDDLGVEGRQEEVAHRLHQDEHCDEHKLLPVRPQVGREQVDHQSVASFVVR